MSQSTASQVREDDRVFVRAELDREEYERLREVKNEAGLTWRGMLVFSADAVLDKLDTARSASDVRTNE